MRKNASTHTIITNFFTELQGYEARFLKFFLKLFYFFYLSVLRIAVFRGYLLKAPFCNFAKGRVRLEFIFKEIMYVVVLVVDEVGRHFRGFEIL